jgi:predicted dehydrogenase
MVGGGDGAFIGSVHRIAARLDDCYELVAGALSSQPAKAAASAAGIRLDPARSYSDFREMARLEAQRPDGIDVVTIVTPNYLHAPVATAFLEAGIHVICDKPLAISLVEGEALARLARDRRRVFALTHVYAGYPMVRHARAMVAAGEIGEVRLVHVEYAQDWLAEEANQGEDYQRNNWHNDPLRAGPAGCLGDIGSHAHHLAGFVSGMQPSEILAELHAFTPGRRVDDHVQVMLRYPNGARGMLWASQMATGCENGLRLRVYGSKASLAFDQEHPNELWVTPQGGCAQRITGIRKGLSKPSRSYTVTRPRKSMRSRRARRRRKRLAACRLSTMALRDWYSWMPQWKATSRAIAGCRCNVQKGKT